VGPVWFFLSERRRRAGEADNAADAAGRVEFAEIDGDRPSGMTIRQVKWILP